MFYLITDNIAELEGKVTESKAVTLLIENQRICLGKNKGVFYAMEDTCPHQNASLGKGKVYPTGGVECPFHHYVFDMKTGECLVGGCRKLKTFPIKQEEGKLFVWVD
jgi:nitrite reductase/ring-hydroxylating ferredoxin subunit